MELKNCQFGDAMEVEFWDLGIVGKIEVNPERQYSEIMPRGTAWGGFVKVDERELVLTNLISSSVINEEDPDGWMVVLPIDTIISWTNYTQEKGASYSKQTNGKPMGATQPMGSSKTQQMPKDSSSVSRDTQKK